jgi:DNA-binding FadR family transcriptional regulator
MEEQGRIRRHVGRGTFLSSLPETPAEIIDRTALKTSPRAAMEARRAVEPQLAWLAAQNATLEQVQELQRLCSAMEGAKSWDEYAELDWRFHNLIAQATANVLLIEVQQLLNSVRRRVVWDDLDTSSAAPPPTYHSFAEHDAVVAAIAAHNPSAALVAMEAHLEGTRQRLLNGRAPGAGSKQV